MSDQYVKYVRFHDRIIKANNSTVDDETNSKEWNQLPTTSSRLGNAWKR